MTELFNNIQLIKNDLVKYLSSINENINWSEFLNKYGTLDDERILKRIRSLIWIDKNLDHNETSLNSTYFQHYTILINKFITLFKKDKIYILNPDPENSNDIIDEFLFEINQKINVIHRLLNIYNIKYEDITSISGEEKIIIPTGSITFANPTKLFNKFKGLIIPDSFNNICFSEKDEILNNVILRIESMRKSNIDEKTLIAKKYGMLKINQ